jgi:hypothetical protein
MGISKNATEGDVISQVSSLPALMLLRKIDSLMEFLGTSIVWLLRVNYSDRLGLLITLMLFIFTS